MLSCKKCGYSRISLKIRCKNCSDFYQKQYKLKNKDKIRLSKKEYRLKNKDKIKKDNSIYYLHNKNKIKIINDKYYMNNKEKKKDYILRTRFGITLAVFNDMLKQQNNVCAICKVSSFRLAVDHCHRTGKIRDLLCFKCNIILGHINEDVTILNNAIDYILKHKESKYVLNYTGS